MGLEMMLLCHIRLRRGPPESDTRYLAPLSCWYTWRCCEPPLHCETTIPVFRYRLVFYMSKCVAGILPSLVPEVFYMLTVKLVRVARGDTSVIFVELR